MTTGWEQPARGYVVKGREQTGIVGSAAEGADGAPTSEQPIGATSWRSSPGGWSC